MSNLPPANGNGKTAWSFFASSVPVIALAFGGLWALISMQMNGQLAPILADIASSKTDRGDTRERLERVTESLNTVREEVVTLKAALTETETQFRATENYINLMRADQLRVDGLLWQKTFGAIYPDAAFFPSIARPK